MQALIAPLKELAEYDEIRKVTRQGKGTLFRHLTITLT